MPGLEPGEPGEHSPQVAPRPLNRVKASVALPRGSAVLCCFLPPEMCLLQSLDFLVFTVSIV